MSELRQKRKCPKILQQEAEEQRAVRQCLREWQRWPGPGPGPGPEAPAVRSASERSASEASTEVPDSKWLAQALAKIEAALAQIEGDLAQDLAN